MTMIFATVGTQLPFDRLLDALDAWAGRNRGIPVVAQTGATRRVFANLRTVTSLGQAEFMAQVAAARLIVSHAGMGTILSAAELGKPVILMPRLARFGEHRNDHQIDTAAEMARLSNVTVVDEPAALEAALEAGLGRAAALATDTVPGAIASRSAAAPLVAELRDFVWNAAPVRAREARQ
jgi:UDP-N-acetylglucosamine transferase subunit ALG13